jgi:hypothetical protein
MTKLLKNLNKRLKNWMIKRMETKSERKNRSLVLLIIIGKMNQLKKIEDLPICFNKILIKYY